MSMAEVVPELMAALREGDSDLRHGAAQALQAIGDPAVPALAGALSDPDFRARSREHDQMANDLEPAIEKIADQVRHLVLMAPRDGIAMGVPQKETIGQYLNVRDREHVPADCNLGAS